jgi:hypothetical protein
MTLKFIWKGRWKNGEISIEAQNLAELTDALNDLGTGFERDAISNESFPKIPKMSGCTDAVRKLMEQEWGKQPRLMVDIRNALKANDIHFPRGNLQASLSVLIKKGNVRRIKEAGKWKYFANKAKA